MTDAREEPPTIPGRVTVGDTDQDKTVQITIDLPEPGGHILGLDVPVDLGVLAQRVVIEVRIEDLLSALRKDEQGGTVTAARDELAELIRNTDAWMLGYERDLADAILTAGWRAPKPDELSDAARDNLEHWSRDRLDG